MRLCKNARLAEDRPRPWRETRCRRATSRPIVADRRQMSRYRAAAGQDRACRRRRAQNARARSCAAQCARSPRARITCCRRGLKTRRYSTKSTERRGRLRQAVIGSDLPSAAHPAAEPRPVFYGYDEKTETTSCQAIFSRTPVWSSMAVLNYSHHSISW